MHNIFKYLYTSIFCVLIAGHVTAQNADSLVYSHHAVRSFGIVFPRLNCPLLSPLNHSGCALSFHSIRFRDKPKYLTQIQLCFEPGLLYNHVNDSYVTSLIFRGDWSSYRHVTDKKRALRFLCGLNIDAGINIYLKDDNVNNPVAYFFNLSASPSIMGKYRFNVGKSSIELGQQIDLPVGSLVSSSGYSTSVPYALTEHEADFFDAMRLVSFGSFSKYTGTTTVDITPPLAQRHKWPSLRITYIFSGMHYRIDDFSIHAVNHTIMAGGIFHLFR